MLCGPVGIARFVAADQKEQMCFAHNKIYVCSLRAYFWNFGEVQAAIFFESPVVIQTQATSDAA